MKIKVFKAHKSVELPEVQTENSVAVDLRANFVIGDRETITGHNVVYEKIGTYSANDKIIIFPYGRVLIRTGIHIAVPIGYEGLIRPRSGLALKHGITVGNSPGVIDSDYRGEIMVILANNGQEAFTVKHGDRIAQLAVRKAETIEWQTCLSLDALGITKRGEGGFGHTGTK